MGFWRAAAYAIDARMAQEADRQQAAYNAQRADYGGGGPGIVRGLVGSWQARREARLWWSVNGQPDPYQRQPSTVTRMLDSARGRCQCGDPNCRYNR